MKNKTPNIILIIGAIIWLLNEFYFFIKRITGGNWVYYKDHLFDLFLTSLMLLVPICLLIFAIAQWRNRSSNEPLSVNTLADGEESLTNLSVGEWLMNYLIIGIPLVGFICLVIWANDDRNKIRQNWAVAMLVWSGIIYILLIFLYITVFASMLRHYY